MDFIPFDIQCYNKLNDKFQFLFEPELINEICQRGQLRRFASDELIMDIGDDISHMPLVVEGSIKVMTEDEEGDELLLYYLEYGDTCAVTLNCCTRKSKSTVRAIAETSVELLFIPIELLEEWMIKYKSWRNYVLDSYNSRLNEMVKAIDIIVFKSMEERLKKYLRDKAWIGKDSMIHTSHAEIANDLHSSRVVISRLMKKLEKQGLIKQSRNKVEYLEFAQDA